MCRELFRDGKRRGNQHRFARPDGATQPHVARLFAFPFCPLQTSYSDKGAEVGEPTRHIVFERYTHPDQTRKLDTPSNVSPLHSSSKPFPYRSLITAAFLALTTSTTGWAMPSRLVRTVAYEFDSASS